MPLTKRWQRRFKKLQDHSKDSGAERLTYQEMADVLGISRSNISVKFSEISEEMPDAIDEQLDGSLKRFKIDFDALIGSTKDEADKPPAWMHENTMTAIYDALDSDVGENEHLEFEQHVRWNTTYQRGGVLVKCFENGQKHHEWERVLRVDNCIVL